jgi:hypothetical protein
VPEPILLWPEGAPGAIADAQGTFTDEDKPAIYAYPVPATMNTGAAFLILPGGAFTNRAIDQEGIQIARWLNRHGISGFVLRYRIRPNYDGQASMIDAYRGMRFIRAHAAEYKVDGNRVGAIGFSAGAELEPPVVDPVALAPEPPEEAGSSIELTPLVTIRPTPPTETTTSPRLALTIETSGAAAERPLCASQMPPPTMAATTSAVTARARWGLREINAGMARPSARTSLSRARRRLRSR